MHFTKVILPKYIGLKDEDTKLSNDQIWLYDLLI